MEHSANTDVVIFTHFAAARGVLPAQREWGWEHARAGTVPQLNCQERMFVSGISCQVPKRREYEGHE